MAHNKKFVLSAVDNVSNNVDSKILLKAMTVVSKEIDIFLKNVKIFEEASFKWIGLMLRISNGLSHFSYSKIDRKDAELPAFVEVPYYEFESKSEKELEQIISKISIGCLIDIAEKYDLPNELLLQKKEELSKG